MSTMSRNANFLSFLHQNLAKTCKKAPKHWTKYAVLVYYSNLHFSVLYYKLWTLYFANLITFLNSHLISTHWFLIQIWTKLNIFLFQSQLLFVLKKHKTQENKKIWRKISFFLLIAITSPGVIKINFIFIRTVNKQINVLLEFTMTG